MVTSSGCCDQLGLFSWPADHELGKRKLFHGVTAIFDCNFLD
jgi:hypothetical protein